MFLMDTTTVSEFRKMGAGRADAGVVTWNAETRATDLFVSVVTIMELEVGVLRAERVDAVRGAHLRRWLDHVLPSSFGDRILPVDDMVARRAATFHVPHPAPTGDSLIAATALVHGLTVVTRNVRDFERFHGVRVLNPWSGG